MIIKWKSRSGIATFAHENDWHVLGVRIHTVSNMLRKNGFRKDTVVMAVIASPYQLQKIIDDNGKWNIPLCIIGLEVFPLTPNVVHWTWKPPKGYEHIQPIEYVSFELVEETP